MIFECDKITALLLQWQSSKSPELETEILEGCTNLIEAIVSQFDPKYRDDLIQESYARILYAGTYYKSSAGTLHNYFTSVIRNTCITYLSKQPNDVPLDDITDDDIDTGEYTDVIMVAEQDSNHDLLTELIERNRKRFPSMPTDDIDSLSEHIYYTLKNSGSYPRDLPKTLSDKLCIPIMIVRLICNSSIIWLRHVNISNAMINHHEATEFTLLKDLEEIVDASTYRTLRIAFSGITLRIP